MALNLKHPDADLLARRLAAATGESITEAVIQSLRERLARLESSANPSLKEELAAIRERCQKLPRLDPRSSEDILGYDSNGLCG